jgi:Cytochrome c oxidase assembly protein PET191
MSSDSGTKVACQAMFDALVRCLSDSKCVRIHPEPKLALKDCAHPDAEGVNESCKATRVAYWRCRMAQIDNRRRIRGPPKF